MSGRPHGRTKYVVEKCRCDICRAACREYERERRRRTEPPYVSADAARVHLRFLADHGVGLKTVAARAGLSHGAISKIVYGDATRGMPPSRRVRKATLDAILAVTPADGADGSKVPAEPTRAAIDRLVAAGVPKVRIAERLGQTKALQVAKGDMVERRTARIIAEMVAELDAGTLVTVRRSRHGDSVIAPAPEPTDDPQPIAWDERDHFIARVASILEDRIDAARWHAPAACRTRPTWLFFPGRGDRETERMALDVCASCPVQQECLDAHIDERDGIWGGMTERQRRAMRRARRLDTEVAS